MRYTEINPSISEAPMNPGEYNKAIDLGQTKGVLVGFEFECIVPKATIRGMSAQSGSKTKADVAKIIYDNTILTDADLDDIPAKKFDELFKFLPGSKYPNMVTATEAYNEAQLEQVKELFNKVPEKVRIKAIPKAKEKMAADRLRPGGNNKQLNFAYYFGETIYNHFDTERSGGGNKVAQFGAKIMDRARRPDLSDLLPFAFGTRGVEENLVHFVDFDPDLVYTALRLEQQESNGAASTDDYRGAVKVLKPALEQTMGRKVTVFNRYHEHKKNMTDWYIEPDGSLNADNNYDGTAEVVSPPLPAKEAISGLRNFFSMAAKMGIYTNESTGLHINISIPETLDILKLAVFAGDQHVLKHFNRLESDYAQSVTREISQNANDDGDAIKVKQGPKKDTNLFGQRKQTTEINTRMLQKIAKDISDDHMASISYNGKWVSFRHTGGNYLKDYTEIFNVVGRFVRAMIIASDPTMYQNEYNAAVAKMVTKDTVGDDTAAMLNYIAANGLPVLEISMVSKTEGPFEPNKLFKRICAGAYGLPENIPAGQLSYSPNSARAKQQLLAKARPAGAFRTWATDAPVDRFVTVVYCPNNAYQVQRFIEITLVTGVSSVYGPRGGGEPVGYYNVNKSVIPKTDPRAKPLILTLRRARHYKKYG